MKKTFLLLSFLSVAIAGMAQQQTTPPQTTPGMPANLFNPLVITNGKAIIDGKNATSAMYNYSGPDSAWTASFSNTVDKEAFVILYTKTTASNLVVTFPSSAVIKQPAGMPGVAFSNNTFTLSSTANGTFQFAIQVTGSNYTVQVVRTSGN
jgi:hypothetical protein